MSYGKLIEYAEAAPEARAVMDDIKAARGVPDVNNAWKAMARHPAVMRRFWERAKAVMQPGALDAPTKELIYLAVSIANGCHYCSASHTALAKKKGATEEQLAEMVEIVGLALEGNSYASFYGQDIDEALKG
ncbi:carboxymuconolactone decarboxylase family protein [Limobrevibacterium gyesilva]|uniref:Carboxymuconolactone decarboxylase family protein n=1 Tax=Limobrevibacterium gyesilva TaxID=2991712 RepID=A0AA41YKT3_9PROT|nr:carboxymuconolactone decarboxylase family protein [Limobrevibacterium gyesilva]